MYLCVCLLFFFFTHVCQYRTASKQLSSLVFFFFLFLK